MINVCHATSCDLLLQFNAKKSHCSAFGKTTVCMKQSMQLGPDVVTDHQIPGRAFTSW